MLNLNKCTNTKSKPKPTVIFKNCSCVCISLHTTVVHNSTETITRTVCFKLYRFFLLGEEAVAYWKYSVACFNNIHVFGYNSAGSERIWIKFGALRVYCLELALTDSGRDLRRSKSGRVSSNCFLSGKQYAISPTSGRPNFTKFAHKTWIWEVVNPFGKHFWEYARKGLFPKRSTFAWTSSTTSDFRPRYLQNDYKSWKVTTGWRAYRMLAFYLYCWNQLKVIPLACRARTQCVLSNAKSRVIYILKKFSSQTLKI